MTLRPATEKDREVVRELWEEFELELGGPAYPRDLGRGVAGPRGDRAQGMPCSPRRKGAQVLEWMKTDARGANVRHFRVKREHRLTQGEVAGGPGSGRPR